MIAKTELHISLPTPHSFLRANKTLHTCDLCKCWQNVECLVRMINCPGRHCHAKCVNIRKYRRGREHAGKDGRTIHQVMETKPRLTKLIKGSKTPWMIKDNNFAASKNVKNHQRSKNQRSKQFWLCNNQKPTLKGWKHRKQTKQSQTNHYICI